MKVLKALSEFNKARLKEVLEGIQIRIGVNSGLVIQAIRSTYEYGKKKTDRVCVDNGLEKKT